MSRRVLVGECGTVSVRLPKPLLDYVRKQAQVEFESDCSWVRRLIATHMRQTEQTEQGKK